MPNNPTYFAMLEACTQPGCPVCRLEQQAVERYLDHLFYESVNDSSTRAHLRASLGFCREHAGLLLDTGLGSALGMSIIYHDVFGTVLKRLKRKNSTSSEGTILARLLGRAPTELAATLERVKHALSPRETCLACQQKDSTARMVLTVLADSIQEKEMLTAFSNSSGLCLPHLRQACEQVQDGVVLADLLKVELEKLEKLHTELAEFIRKNDYRYLKDGFGPEGNAWRRAAILASGGGIDKPEPERNESPAVE
jgi:hypothetical protein